MKYAYERMRAIGINMKSRLIDQKGKALSWGKGAG
jgi:hypothetical protein